MIVAISAAPASSEAATGLSNPRLEWTRLADLPDPVGLKGMYGGISHGRMILAGGSNFPIPRSEGGEKVFHASIYTQPVSAGGKQPWTLDQTVLPMGMAEGACAQTGDGIAVLGGSTGDGPVATAFLMQWDEAAGRVVLSDLPDLPSPRTYAAAAALDGRLYVAGGQSADGAMLEFLVLDPENGWEELPTWVGPRRFGAALVVLEISERDQLVLCGGKIGTAGVSRGWDYLDDAYAFDPKNNAWTKLPHMLRPSLLAPAVRLSPTLLAVCGGSDGHDIKNLEALGSAYRIPDGIMLFDAKRSAWTRAGRMPIGVVGAATIETDDGWIFAGGEYSPGLRTAEVHLLRLSKNNSSRLSSRDPGRDAWLE